MTGLLQRYATPLITGLFLVSLISGAALFFHFGASWFHGMHEWLSMVLIAPFGLHVWKNWRALTTYFQKPAFAMAMVASLIAAGAFAYPALTSTGGANGGGPPPMALSHRIMANPVASVAPLLGKTPEALLDQLTQAGFTIADATQTLADIAAKSGKDEFELAAVLVRPAAK